jgi:hypothetical protein
MRQVVVTADALYIQVTSNGRRSNDIACELAAMTLADLANSAGVCQTITGGQRHQNHTDRL